MNYEPHEKTWFIFSDIDASLAILAMGNYAMASILDIRYRAPHDIQGQGVRRVNGFKRESK